jgi:uncharacterized protein YjaG (DUF416 family)
MAAHRFDEPELKAQLDRLPREHRAAFAAACAERLFPAYKRFARDAGQADPERLRTALDRLWNDLMGEPQTEQEVRASAKTCLALVPSEEDEPTDAQPYAEDAVAALVYALEARASARSQEAAWSARRAFEALHQFVMFDDSGVVVTANEQRLLEHPLVQAELARQHRDMDELLTAKERGLQEVTARIRDRAMKEAATFFGSASAT